MLVHSCYVETPSEERVQLVDARGCSIDAYIFEHLTYAADAASAHRCCRLA